jgi:hypothetical protein
MLIDKVTGDAPEVDVALTSEPAAGVEVIVSIEATNRLRPVEATYVEGVVGKHDALPTNKLITVSSSGFNKGALERAEAAEALAVTPNEIEADPGRADRYDQRVVGRLRFYAALVVGLLLLAGCGGGGGDTSGADSTSAAEAHNEAILQQAEGNAETAAAVEEELDYKLAPFYYSGVEGTFVTIDGDYCTVDEPIVGEELSLYKSDKNTLLSPNGKIGVSVGTFQGTQDAPCLKAVVDALEWGAVESDIPRSGPLTKRDFIKSANAICKEGNDEVEEIYGDDETYGDEAAGDSEARPGYVRRIEEHEALEPPASIASLFDEYVVLLEEQIDLIDKTQTAAATINSEISTGGTARLKQAKKDYKEASDQISVNYEQRERIARNLGLADCAPSE